MKSRDFCYWLQGYFEINGGTKLEPHQVDCIKRHLGLVFAHEIDPSMGPQEHQQTLNAVHGTPAWQKPPSSDGSTPRC